jgi:hypothetical protein
MKNLRIFYVCMARLFLNLDAPESGIHYIPLHRRSIRIRNNTISISNAAANMFDRSMLTPPARVALNTANSRENQLFRSNTLTCARAISLE